MKNIKIYKAIFFGITFFFGGCLVWLFIARNEVQSATTALDHSRLKYEALLAEKLLVDKSLNRINRKLDAALVKNNLLNSEINVTTTVLTEKQTVINKLKKSLSNTRQHQLQMRDTIKLLRNNLHTLADLITQAKIQTDSIARLEQNLTLLQDQFEKAFRKSIDKTLIIAERKNDRITSKARRTRQLIAQVELPSILNNLSFAVEGPDGAVLSTENTISARQLRDERSVTASINTSIVPTFSTKKMEVVYKPKEKLSEGTYVLKIFNGMDYVGSMNVKLR